MPSQAYPIRESIEIRDRVVLLDWSRTGEPLARAVGTQGMVLPLSNSHLFHLPSKARVAPQYSLLLSPPSAAANLEGRWGITEATNPVWYPARLQAHSWIIAARAQWSSSNTPVSPSTKRQPLPAGKL